MTNYVILRISSAILPFISINSIYRIYLMLIKVDMQMIKESNVSNNEKKYGQRYLEKYGCKICYEII
jgi:hypothetical protein